MHHDWQVTGAVMPSVLIGGTGGTEWRCRRCLEYAWSSNLVGDRPDPGRCPGDSFDRLAAQLEAAR